MMRREHLRYLSDPISKKIFDITTFGERGNHIFSGILSAGDMWYPVIDGVPRILVGELRNSLLQTHALFFETYRNQLPTSVRDEWQRAVDSLPDRDAFLEHQRKTAESFSYEWKHIYEENTYEKHNFFHFLSPYLTEEDFRGKITLDIGCGSGRFTKWAALSGAAISYGSDLGETVSVAFDLTKELPNVCIVQADIYAMPFHSACDIAYSIGVLHHLPRPKQGFLALPATIKKGGQFLIWVYNRRNNARALYFYEPLRSLLKKLPKPLLFKLCYIPGLAVHLINLFGKLLRTIGFPSLEKRLPFAYYAHFPFNMKLNDAFDVLATPKSNYYYREDIEGWFRDAALRHVRAHEHPEAGITCIGTREDISSSTR